MKLVKKKKATKPLNVLTKKEHARRHRMKSECSTLITEVHSQICNIANLLEYLKRYMLTPACTYGFVDKLHSIYFEIDNIQRVNHSALFVTKDESASLKHSILTLKEASILAKNKHTELRELAQEIADRAMPIYRQVYASLTNTDAKAIVIKPFLVETEVSGNKHVTVYSGKYPIMTIYGVYRRFFKTLRHGGYEDIYFRHIVKEYISPEVPDILLQWSLINLVNIRPATVELFKEQLTGAMHDYKTDMFLLM